MEVVGPWWLVLAVLTAVLGVGRWTRLAVFDEFPPAMWVRATWTKLTKNHASWTKLIYCWWCFAPWMMLVAIGWFWVGFQVEWVMVAWWLFFGWGALSYASSMIVARDEPKD